MHIQGFGTYLVETSGSERCMHLFLRRMWITSCIINVITSQVWRFQYVFNWKFQLKTVVLYRSHRHSSVSHICTCIINYYRYSSLYEWNRCPLSIDSVNNRYLVYTFWGRRINSRKCNYLSGERLNYIYVLTRNWTAK